MNRSTDPSAQTKTQIFARLIWRKNLFSCLAFIGLGLLVALIGNYFFPLTVKHLIDIAESASHKPIGDAHLAQNDIIKAALLCIGIYLVRTISNSAMMIALYRYRQKTLEWIRIELLSQALRQHGQILSEQQPAEILTRVNQDSVSLVQCVCQMPQNFSVNALSIAISLYFIGQESFTIFIIALCSIAALLLSALTQNKRMKGLTKSAQESQSRYIGQVSRALAAWKTIRIFALQDVFLKTTRDFLQPYLRKTEDYQIRSQLLGAWAATMSQVIYIVYLGFAAYLITKHQISFGSLVAVSTLLSRLSEYTRNLVGVIPDIQNYNNALSNVTKLFERQDDETEKFQDARSGAVSMDSFRFVYDKSKILDQASLNIHSGEKIVVTGANGTGKSTLIHVLLGIFKGEGHLIQPTRQRISAQLTPQALLPVPMREQLNAITKQNNSQNLMEELIVELDLRHLLDRNPDALSVGQLQKFSIMMCLLKRADLYLFDEPLANIALNSRHNVFNCILQRVHGKTIICIMHEGNDILDAFDRVITLEGGQFYSTDPGGNGYARNPI